MSMLHELLALAVEEGASDVHLKPFQEPYFRVSSRLRESGFDVLTPESMVEIVNDIMPAHLLQSYATSHEADFSLQEPEVGRIQPDIYAVNEDGDVPEKREFCQRLGLEYVVLKRTPKEGLPKRESTKLRGF